MIFQPRTLEILKNFASINQGLVIKEGNVLRTCSVIRDVLASATVPDTFTQEFAIYDLNAFLSTLSLFEDPSIEFKDNHVLVASGKSKIKYFYSNPAVVVQPPAKDLVFAGLSLSFTLTESDWKQIQKAASVLRLDKLNIASGSLRATGEKDNQNTFDVNIDTEGELAGSVFLKIEKIKLIPGDYKVEVFDRAVKFSHLTEGAVYHVAIESE